MKACSYKHSYTNVHSSIIHDSQNVETIQIHQLINEQNVVYAYHKIFRPKKEWNIDIRYNIDKSWKHAKSKKPVTKDHNEYDSIYTKRPELAKP